MCRVSRRPRAPATGFSRDAVAAAYAIKWLRGAFRRQSCAMNMRSRLTFTILTALAFLAGIANPACAGEAPLKPLSAAPDAKPEAARLTKAEAIRIAREEAVRAKANLERYNEPTATYYRKDKRWFVSFMGKKPMPGNHCSVSIDDRTGKARFAGGM